MLDNSFEDDMQRTVAAGAAEDAGPAVAVEDEIDVDVEWLDDGPDGVWPVGPEGGAGVVPENGADGDPEDFGDLDDEDEAEEIGYDDYMLGIIGVVKSALESDGIEPDVLAAEVKNLHEGPESPASAAAAGNSRIGEALGDLYMNEMLFNCGRLGLSVEECRQRATGFLYKAACDVGYPARGDCAFKLALLFYAPRYEAPDLKQAKDWFGWTAQELEKSAPHKAAEAWLYLGRIAEAEGDYAEAARCRKKHDGLSGDRRGEAEQARLLIAAGIDGMAGITTLAALAEEAEPYASVILAELPWIVNFADELDSEYPYDALEGWLLRDSSLADAQAALGGYLLAVADHDDYLESYEEESFYKHLMVAYNMNSVMASYYLGKFYTHQCGAAIDEGRDSGTISGLADKALFYLRQAAGTGYVPAMRDYATVNSLCHGFDADTAKYCSFLQIFGETDHAQDLLSRKEELDKDKLFID